MKRILLFLLSAALPLSANDLAEAETFLHKILPNAEMRYERHHLADSLKNEIETRSGQRFQKDFVHLWQIQGEKSGYALLDVVRSKSALITALVLFDAQGEVTLLELLEYSGEHRRAVTRKAWLRQFIGKNSRSTLKLGDDIDGISGATYSAEALTRAVRRWSLLVETFR